MTNAWRTPQAGIFVLKKEKTSGAGVIGFTRTDGRPCCWPAVEASSRNGWLSLSLGITLRNLPVFSLPGQARAAAGRRRAQRAYVAELAARRAAAMRLCDGDGDGGAGAPLPDDVGVARSSQLRSRRSLARAARSYPKRGKE